MAKPVASRKARFEFKPAFEESLARHVKRTPAVSAALQAFITAKMERPPLALPRGMRDHALTGGLAAFKECHLGHDSCLLYTDKGDVVTLVLIVDHDEMSRTRAKSLTKRLDRG